MLTYSIAWNLRLPVSTTLSDDCIVRIQGIPLLIDRSINIKYTDPLMPFLYLKFPLLFLSPEQLTDRHFFSCLHGMLTADPSELSILSQTLNLLNETVSYE